ncbi:MAG TPA: flagellar basal-body MS-ring/collar protein FliF [Hyphomicrobiales bacterium]|nr:flagellar basal-body MS-ring/collar protein FliF [Hyphomicrobiales bacterium]
MASTALAHSALEQINQLSRLPWARQAGFMIVLAAAIALGTSVALWSQQADYVVLFPDGAAQDKVEVAAALENARIAYRLEPGSGRIAVPAADLQQARLQLATQGLPRSNAGNGAFEALQQGSAIGTSNFVEQARYTHALEQELVTTIKLLSAVRDARVHLSIPKQTSFLRNGSKPSASVMLDLVGGQHISDTQIAGIAHLVASSVAGLESERVSIVDQKGSLLSRQNAGALEGSSDQLRHTRTLEEEYTQRILTLLTPIVGEGRIRAQVTAELDFTVVETTAENYDPNKTVLRSEQSLQETRGDDTAPLPGALTPTPPLDAAGNVVAPEVPVLGLEGTPPAATPPTDPAATTPNSGQRRFNTTRNYEVDRSISHTRTVPGGIKRLSVAVVVDLLAPPAAPAAQVDDDEAAAAAAALATQQQEKLARLTQLVKDSVGYSAARGDSVNVISEAFSEPSFPVYEAATPPLWQQPWVPAAARNLAAGLVVVLLIFAVLRPALRTVVAPAAPAPVQLIVERDVRDDDEPEKLPARSAFDENLQLAQNIVRSEPARAARMIKDWVAND